MFHPLQTDLSEIKDQDLESKVEEITKKYYAAYKLGNPEILTQLSTFLIIYKEELNNRYKKRNQNSLNGDLDQLINVD
jgi:hypothetical protein